jgi:hypothetical protein
VRAGTAATRDESINDIIERMDPSVRTLGIRVPMTSSCHVDELDLLADVGETAYGPAAILAIFGRMLQRSRWALYRNQGRAATNWSAGERLSVALVLGDREALAEMGYTPVEAADTVSAVLDLPPNEIDNWIGELRAAL